MVWLVKNARKLEIWGLVLILTAAGWQIFFEDVINSATVQAEFYGLKEQLYLIWEAFRSGDPTSYSQQNDVYNRFFDAYQSGRGFRDLDWVSWVRFSIYGIGSGLLILAKAFEVK